MKHSRRMLPIVAVALLAQTLLAGRSGCGTQEQKETLNSPVQALGTIYGRPDGAVFAELVLITTKDKEHRFIESAEDVTLSVDGEVIRLEKDPARPGHWTASSSNEPRLVLEDGTRYMFGFVVPDAADAGELAGEKFMGEVRGRVATSSVIPTVEALAGHTLDIDISPALTGDVRGVYLVRGPSGQVTYENFDTSTPRFDGSKHARLVWGSKHVIPGDAFPEPGEYTIEFYTMNYTAGFDPHISAELGLFAGFMAGKAVEVSVTVR